MSDILTLPVASHQVVGTSFTPERIEQRRQTLGASEVPAVLGLDRYKSPLDVYLSKKGLVPSFAGNDHTEWGLRMEPAIRQKVADVLNLDTIEQRGTLIHPEHSWVSATPDGEFEYDGWHTVLEMKNKTERQAIYWGPSGTDEIPHDVAAQAHWQMFVTGAERAIVAVLLGKADFRLYFLASDLDITAGIFARCEEFWTQHVLAGVQPEVTGGKQIADYLRAKFGTHGDRLRDATREEALLIAELKTVRADITTLEETEDALKNKLMAAIGEDAGLLSSVGRVTWKRPNGVQTSWKDVALALAAQQALIEEFSKPQARKFLCAFPKEG
jgi:putative phage-type endonuclease